jgi:glycine betaine/proline transport system substrate-binding protein
MKLKMLTATAAFALSLGATSASASCGKVSITEMDWASSAVVTAVANFLMTQGYGCDVQVVPSSTVPALTSLAETGEPDILTEVWANSTPAYEGLLAEGKLVELTNVLSDGGVEAWWIPAYLAESNPELTTWDGIMANPAAVGGKFHDCPSGWACDIINNNNLKAAGAKLADWSAFNTVQAKRCKPPSLRPMQIRHLGLATIGPQPQCSVNTQWSGLKCQPMTQRPIAVTATLIVPTLDFQPTHLPKS